MKKMGEKNPPPRVINEKNNFSTYSTSKLLGIKLQMEEAAERKYVALFIYSLPRKKK